MGCVTITTDSNGFVKESPQATNMIRMIDSKLDRGEPISSKDIITTLQNSYLVRRGGINKVEDKSGLSKNLYQIMLLNGILMLNYKASKPLLNIIAKPLGKTKKPIENYLGTPANPNYEYEVAVNPTVLSELKSKTAFTHTDHTINYEFNYNKLDESTLTPVAQQLLKREATPTPLGKLSKVKQSILEKYGELVFREAAVLNNFSKQNLDSIAARLQNTSESKPLTESEKQIDYQSAKDQIIKLQSVFNSVGIPVKVVVDPKLEVKGDVTKDANGQITLRINPLKMTEDTHIHEFSHILIELLGEDNPTIKRAIEEIKDTELYSLVQAKYPELTGSRLDFEVLATAMGLEGAKFNRKNPSKIQTIVNRILRAIKEFFNIETDTAVQELVSKMLEGRLDRKEFSGEFVEGVRRSKTLKEETDPFKKLVNDTRQIVYDSIQKEERNIDSDINKQAALDRLKLLQARLKEVNQVEDFVDFVNYTASIASRAKEVYDEIMRDYPDDVLKKMSHDERMVLMNKIFAVGDWVGQFFGDGKNNSNVMQRILSAIKNKKDLLKDTDPAYQFLDKLETKLGQSILNITGLNQDYIKFAIPIQADNLLEYHTPEINTQLEILIANIENNKRIVGLVKDDEYYDLMKQEKDGKITKAQLKEALIALNIQQLKNKEIGRETLIRELTEAQTDKSAFSYMLDPLVYSTQPTLQLFALSIRNMYHSANDEVQNFINEFKEGYDKFKAVKGSDINPNTFNEDLLETQVHYVYNPQTNKKEKISILTLVQPLNVNKYREDENAMYEKYAKQFNRPDTEKELEVWKKSADAKKYYRAVGDWYRTNAVINPKIKTIYDNLANSLQVKIAKLANVKNTTKDQIEIDYLEAEIARIKGDMLTYKSETGYYKAKAYMPGATYSNPKFKAMSGATLEYYNFILDKYKDLQKNVLGVKSNLIINPWDDFSYMMPTIRSEGLEKVQKDGAFGAAKDFAKDTYDYFSTDVNYGDLINQNKDTTKKLIPIFHTNAVDEKLVSRDIATSMIHFAGMAYLFRAKSKVAGSVMLMREMVKNREVLEINSAGNTIINRGAEMLGFVKHQRKDGLSNNFKHLSEFIDKVFFGEEELKQSFNFRGKELSANKLANKFASYTALNTLSFNLLQAFNQGVVDNVKLLEEAVAGQYWSTSNWSWATKTYHLTKDGGLGSAKDYQAFTPETKIVQAIQMFDALGERFNNATKKRSGNKVLRSAAHIPMTLQQLAEHETAVKRMLALMDSYRAIDHKVEKKQTLKDIALKYNVSVDSIKQWNKLTSDTINEGTILKIGKLLDDKGNIIKNKDGTYANVYDILIKDPKTGKFIIDPKVANFNIQSFRNKLAGITKKTNQIKLGMDDAMLQRRWYGKLVMLFRRYFIPSLRRYYGHTGLKGGIHMDLETNTISEGTLITLKRFITESYENGFNFVKVFKMMSPMEQQNMRRNFVQFGFLTLSMVIAYLILDDDDDEDYASQFMAYQALRLDSELTQFANPVEFVRLASSPTAVIRPLMKIIELGGHIMTQEIPYFVTGDTDGVFYERKSGIHEKGDRKTAAKVENIIPILRGLFKSMDPKTASQFFNAPIGSAQ